MKQKPLIAGLIVAALVVLGIYVGSLGGETFDPAVWWYAAGSVAAAFATAYRFTIWAERPPTQMYLKRGLKNLPQQLLKARAKAGQGAKESIAVRWTAFIGAFSARYLVQSFIQRRSNYRWIMHLCLSGGCTLAFAITFPLVFGWVHFSTLPGDAEIYQMRVFGVALDSFSIHSFKAFMVFNLLNFAAVFVIVGLAMAAWRRCFDAGERATQTFSEDIVPLLIIFAVTATGLMLTVSYKFMDGAGHGTIAVAHMISVIALLLYIPFGKLFHMLQRIGSLMVWSYKKTGEEGAQAYCVRCGSDFASQLHVDDLKTVLDQLGFNYRFETPHGEVHYQDICPACRRRLMGLNQGKALGR